MMAKKNTKLTALDELFRAVCGYFKDKFDDSSASANDVKNAIQFLKDNGISATLSQEYDSAPLNQLVESAQQSEAIQFPFPVNPSLLPADDPALAESKG